MDIQTNAHTIYAYLYIPRDSQHASKYFGDIYVRRTLKPSAQRYFDIFMVPKNGF